MHDRVKIDVSPAGIADVRLNRPEKRNALDYAMFAGILDAVEELAGDTSVRVVVLSGEGAAFCAGLDFGVFAGTAEGPRVNLLARDEGSPANTAQQAVWGWHTLPVPVIAAVHGQAYGGGCQIALGADIRILHPEATMSVMEIKWGLIPDMCGPQLLPRLVGIDVAKELTWTGRVVDADEAVRIGLATRIAPDPLAAALALAGEIAAKNPDAIRLGKRLIEESAAESDAAGLLLEEESQLRLVGSPNQLEAVQANFEKRPPRFEDPASTP
ncbi:MAG: crotonase/enoyl-CoA hydratase family protein [Acidimicrobiia bacterium]|nr:crotonase/enoyl-CoA hydratase family protein [Acidimicrobiia bacterium]